MLNAQSQLITGGQRSGKSAYGEQLALSLDDRPTYLATSQYWDEEHQKRIELHQERRGHEWHTVEEALYISQVKPVNQVLFVDCITLWLTNVMEHFQYDPKPSFDFVQNEWQQLLQQNAIIIAITNEIGMGVIPMDKSTRQFVDLQGKVNQYIAKEANQVTFMVSGLPLKVK